MVRKVEGKSAPVKPVSAVKNKGSDTTSILRGTCKLQKTPQQHRRNIDHIGASSTQVLT